MSGLNLNPTQLDRYSRHIIMDEVGPEGQRQLLDASVIVVGAGGLGSPVIQYLAAAGVGTIGIADHDLVELSNVQRQIIHGTDDVGRPKAESAAEYVNQLNPDVTVVQHEIEIGPENVESVIDEYDVVVDASDNFRTRFVLNDACVLAGVPLSHGAIYRFEGQVTTFPQSDPSPCYRCLFPEAPPEGAVPNCAEVGVLGVLPGTVGCIQATEVVKLVLDAGTTLDGRVLFYDAMALSFEEIEFDRNPACPVCGENGIESVAEVAYRGSCAVGAD